MLREGFFLMGLRSVSRLLHRAPDSTLAHSFEVEQTRVTLPTPDLACAEGIREPHDYLAKKFKESWISEASPACHDARQLNRRSASTKKPCVIPYDRVIKWRTPTNTGVTQTVHATCADLRMWWPE